jgi:hypothetical protein
MNVSRPFAKSAIGRSTFRKSISLLPSKHVTVICIEEIDRLSRLKKLNEQAGFSAVGNTNDHSSIGHERSTFIDHTSINPLNAYRTAFIIIYAIIYVKDWHSWKRMYDLIESCRRFSQGALPLGTPPKGQ